MTKHARPSAVRRRVLIAAGGFLVFVIGLTAAWQLTPLQEYAEPHAIARQLRAVADTAWFAPVVLVLHAAASLLMVPNTVLCLAIILALGPVFGTAYAFGGSALAALAGYTVGRRGGERVDALGIRAFEKVSKELRRGAFVQVLLLRLLPGIPFMILNILAGAARIRVVPFLAATLIGIAPYIITFAAFGRQARRLLSDPTPTDAVLAAVIVVLAAVALWKARSLAAARSR